LDRPDPHNAARPSSAKTPGSANLGGPQSRGSRAASPWRIAVAVRPALFCEILTARLREEPELEVVGSARDEEELRVLLAKSRPGILLFDYEGLGPAAELAIRRLRRTSRGTRILVLATRSGDETLERVLRAGAAGLFAKQQPYGSLVRAIHAVASGELWANRAAAAHVVERLVPSAEADRHVDERLTQREWEIVDAVGQGIRNKEIGTRLRISEKTVKSHLNSIFRKLRVDNRFAVGLYSLDRQRPRA
jgi:DNA-binding NarL/FixJ family response regulator